MPRAKTGRPPGRPIKLRNGDITGLPDDINEDSLPDAPSSLGIDGQSLWYLLWANGGNLLTPADQFVATELCQIYEEKEFVRKALSSGAVPRAYRTPNGQINNHPFVKQLADARVQMNTLISSLGFSPADRARLGVLDALAEDPELKALTERRQKREAEREAKREANK